MPNRKTVENESFNNLGLQCDEYGKVSLIYRKTCRQYSSSNNEVASSSNLIKAQIDKFITRTDAIKKKNDFFDHVNGYAFFGNAFRSNFFC